MALKDKLVNLEGLKAVYDDVAGRAFDSDFMTVVKSDIPVTTVNGIRVQDSVLAFAEPLEPGRKITVSYTLTDAAYTGDTVGLQMLTYSGTFSTRTPLTLDTDTSNASSNRLPGVQYTFTLPEGQETWTGVCLYAAASKIDTAGTLTLTVTYDPHPQALERRIEALEATAPGTRATAASLAPAETVIASTNHAAGSLLTLGGQLRTATQAIAAGAVIGDTNTVATSVADLFAVRTLSNATGDITNTDTTYAFIGTTDSRLYVYPFGLAILSGYFKITTTPGATERTFAHISVKPLRQVGMTIVSQNGKTCYLAIDANGDIKCNTNTSDATGTYHIAIAFPCTPLTT